VSVLRGGLGRSQKNHMSNQGPGLAFRVAEGGSEHFENDEEDQRAKSRAGGGPLFQEPDVT